ncbi:hypothetical protein [Pseudoalteromonas denitrificans]|uniref:Uncharacterized protein n=1 Tax=Pseudoalteromonas denitrificans DSM 6059 TaxID=1123010 RepID=A0A1I1QG52_9GAMM|nr:hypothetical protein [Pseudoalteromonas denitrificans]SFD21055.1 hypothetical protein SAMN02745724_03872 [Pseudoalteromonas denitrificans DSM 6059]
MVVHFKNKQRHEIKISAFIARYSESRLTHQPEEAREINKITFWYYAKGGSEKAAYITILGKH